MAMVVDREYITTCIVFLDLPRGNSIISNPVLKVAGDKIVPIIQHIGS